MRKLLASIAVVLSLALYGCPTQPIAGQEASILVPRSPTQAVYAAEVSLTAATNALADLHNAGTITGSAYASAYAIQKQAHEVLLDFRKAAMGGDVAKAEALEHLLLGLIDDLTKYNGGKK